MKAVVSAIEKFRKKYTLALLLYASGTIFAFYVKASMTEYTIFAGVLLAIFGTADLVDKKVLNK